ncbi:metallophosphoesterase family protein [Dyadobacter sp. OTU695]|uniref:metallophosphoesterase family protein n=1 Tax=Dyadobacter sp. OTU695 TaxID=3043860 RepID=UPI00313B8C27
MRLQRKLKIESVSWIICILLLTGCDSFEFSANQVSDRDSPRDLNSKNLTKLFSNPTDDTVTVVFVGDSQRWYDQLDRFVKKINTLDNVDLVLLAGDISDFGLLQEFEWVNDRLSGLEKPYVGVIGNHDLVANGEEVYTRMFGRTDFSFVYDSVKFICHNTNSLEYSNRKIPDMTWLSRELSGTTDAAYIVTVSHVPPFSPLEFDRELAESYPLLLSQTPKMLLSLHGHVHQHLDFYPFGDGVRYMTSYAFNQNAFVLLKIVNGKVLKSIVGY